MEGLDLAEVTTALAILWGVHGLILLPGARRRLAAVDDNGKPKWASVVLALETSQLMCLAALISAALTWAVLWAATRGSGTSSLAVAQKIEQIQTIERYVGELKVALFVWAFVLATVGLYYWVVRRRQAQFSEAREALAEEKFNRLLEEFNRGELPPLDPTPQMQESIAVLHGIDQEIQQVSDKLKEAGTDAERPEQQSTLSRLEGIRRSVFQNLVLRDLSRRIELPPHDPDLIGLPPPARTFWQKLGRIFVSRGMFRHLGLGQRALLILNVLLLVPSLLTLTGPAVAVSLEGRITQLDQLRVSLVAQEAEQRYDAATRAAAVAPAAETMSDQTFTEIAHVHARAFEGAISRNVENHFHLPPNSGRDGQAFLREQDARRRILSTMAERANAAAAGHRPDTLAPPSGRQVEAHGLVAQPAEHGVPFDEMAHRAALGAASPSPRALTPAGESLAEEIISRGRADPNFRQRVMQSFRESGASFFEAARPSQLRGVVLAAALGGSAETAVLNEVVAEPVARWASEAMQPGFRARAYQTYSRTYLATLVETGDASKAIKVVESMPDHHLLRAEVSAVRSTLTPRFQTDAAMISGMERFPPGLVEIRDGITRPDAAEVAERFYRAETTRRHINITPERLKQLATEAPALASYERYFPSDHATGSGGGGVGSRTGNTAGATRTSMHVDPSRSRSFVRLRGFSRVGGVLIGRDPEQNSALDIRDIQWTLTGKRLTLRLTDAERKQVSIGPIPASIAHLALGYAADGRPLTVTMTVADPLRELRILLHPVLIDTPIGCRAIEIDRFIDEATPPSSKRAEISALLEIQKSLYAAARAALVKAVFSSEDAKALIDRDDEVAGLVDLLASGTERNADLKMMKSVFDQAMKQPSLLFEARYSPLKVKSAYFHPRVVQLLDSCTRPNGNYADLKRCLTTTASRLAETQRTDLRSEKSINWSAPTPTFQVWSGVRERPYTLDQRMTFALVAQSSDPPPEPFDFIIQVAFTSPPFASQTKPWYEDSDARDEDDPNPWLFPDQDVKVKDSVVELINNSAVKRDTFTVMRQFVGLQRLFRTGLAGRLGSNFPVERLTDLAQATAATVEPQRTLRWNVRTPSEVALLHELLTRFATFSLDGKSKAAACLNAVGLDPERITARDEAAVDATLRAAQSKLYGLSDDDWDKVCRFTEESFPKEIAEFSGRASDIRRLRAALGVREDEKLIQAGSQCRPL